MGRVAAASRLFQGGRNGRVGRVERGAYAVDGHEDNDRDQACDQAILDGGGGRLVLNKTNKRLHGGLRC
jgi:hypothetical protein